MLHGLLFAVAATEFGAAEIEGFVADTPVEPAHEGGVFRKLDGERAGLARQIGEELLGDIPGEVGRLHLAQRGGIDQIRVAADELGEGGFGAFGGIVAQELDVGHGLHSPVKPPPLAESDRKLSPQPPPTDAAMRGPMDNPGPAPAKSALAPGAAPVRIWRHL